MRSAVLPSYSACGASDYFQSCCKMEKGQQRYVSMDELTGISVPTLELESGPTKNKQSNSSTGKGYELSRGNRLGEMELVSKHVGR